MSLKKFKAAEVTKAKTNVDTLTFQWVTWREEVGCPLGVSIDFDDKNNLVRVVDIFEEQFISGEESKHSRDSGVV